MNKSRPSKPETGSAVHQPRERRALTPVDSLRAWASGAISPSSVRPDASPQPIPAHAAVEAAVVSWLNDTAVEGHDGADVVWAENFDGPKRIARELLGQIDAVVDKQLRDTLEAARQVTRWQTKQPEELEEVIAVGQVTLLMDELASQIKLRELTLTESTYQAWVDVTLLSQRLHEQLAHLTALCAQQIPKYDDATTILGSPRSGPSDARVNLARAAGTALGRLVAAGLSNPELAEEVARSTRDMRRGRAVFLDEGRQAEWDCLTDACGDPMVHAIGPKPSTAGLFLRRFVMPVRSGEGKRQNKQDDVPKPGIHYKRHGDLGPIDAVCELYRTQLPAALWLPTKKIDLTRGLKADWNSFIKSLWHLQTVSLRAAQAVQILYGRPFDFSRQTYHGSVLFQLSSLQGDLQRRPPNQSAWISLTHIVNVVGDESGFRQDLQALRLGDHALYDGNRFCPVCYRTVAARSYCHLHAASDSRGQGSDRTPPNRWRFFAEVLTASRERRFASLKNEVFPAEPSDPTAAKHKAVRLSHMLYRQAAKVNVETHGEPPLSTRVDQIIVSMDETITRIRTATGPESALSRDHFKQIERVLKNRDLSHIREQARAWRNTFLTIEALETLASEVDRWVEAATPDPEVVKKFGLPQLARAEELRRFFTQYAEWMLMELATAATESRAPLTPDNLRTHFLTLWFRGHPGILLEGRLILQTPEKDGNPDLLSDLSFASVAERIERWALWISTEGVRAPKKQYKVDAAEEIMALKGQGQTMAQIAASMRMTYDAVRQAIARFERRQAELAAGKKPKPRGRPASVVDKGDAQA